MMQLFKVKDSNKLQRNKRKYEIKLNWRIKQNCCFMDQANCKDRYKDNFNIQLWCSSYESKLNRELEIQMKIYSSK